MKPEVIVSYSELYAFQTCKRQHYYKHTLGYQPIEESDAINTGINGHKLLQNFYELMREGKTKEEALTAISDQAKKLINKDKFADFSLLHAWTMVDQYIRTLDFRGEAVLIENRFLIPVARFTDDPNVAHVQIGFTPDLVLERTGKFLDIEDAKFVQRAWAKKKLDKYIQTKLYDIFLTEIGYNVSRTLIRFFNVKTKEISTYPYVLKTEERASITEDFVAAVQEFIAFKESGSRPNRTICYTACQYCPFVFPCNLEAQGKDATKVFTSMYRKNTYDYAN